MEIGTVLVADKSCERNMEISIGQPPKRPRPQFYGKTNNIGQVTQLNQSRHSIFFCWYTFVGRLLPLVGMIRRLVEWVF